jgi:hypothetical protein
MQAGNLHANHPIDASNRHGVFGFFGTSGLGAYEACAVCVFLLVENPLPFSLVFLLNWAIKQNWRVCIAYI